MKGGVFVGKGTYGCVYKPALACERDDKDAAAARRHQISKFMKPAAADEEMTQQALWAPIDPDQKYFLYPLESCPPKHMTEAELDACSDGEKEGRKRRFDSAAAGSLVQMNNGGIDVYVYPFRRIDLSPFFKSCSNLFEGLIQAGTRIHMDIKPANIVTDYTPERYEEGGKKFERPAFTTRYIDFGLSFDSKDLVDLAKEPRFSGSMRTPYKIFSKNYPYWGPEVFFANPATKADGMDETYLKTFQSDFFARQVPHKPFKALTLETMTAIGRRLVSLDVKKRHETIFKGSDLLALGRTLSELYYDHIGHFDFGNEGKPEIYINQDDTKKAILVSALKPSTFYSSEAVEWHKDVAKNISTPFYKLIRSMMHPNVFERCTIQQAKAAYDAIFVNEDNREAHINRLFSIDNLRRHLKPWAFRRPLVQVSLSPSRLSRLLVERSRRGVRERPKPGDPRRREVVVDEDPS